MAAILLLDTCGATGLVAVVSPDAATAPIAHALLPGRETQERLLGTIAQTLAVTGCASSQLAAVVVVTGPGSFTGVRIGLAAAKGFAEATGMPLIGLSRLAVLAEAARPSAGDNSTVTAWIDAGRTDVYAGTYVLEPGLPRRVGQAMLPRTAAITAAIGVIATEDDALAGLVPAALRLPQAEVHRATERLAVLAFAAGAFADTALIDANYLRVPDAELALRDRLAAA